MRAPYILHENPTDYFGSEGKGSMLFSRAAARQILELAASRGIEIWRYEGGIFREGTFEARLDAIWDRLYGHTGPEFLEAGNLRAVTAIYNEAENYNAFIITGGPPT